MVRRFAFVGAAAMLVAVGTALVGWAGVPVTAAIVAGVSAVRGRPRVAGRVAFAAVLAWAALLAWDATGPRFGALVTALGGVLRLPVALVVLVTLALPALLAWAAAAFVDELAGAARARSTDRVTLPAPGAPARPTGFPAAAPP